MKTDIPFGARVTCPDRYERKVSFRHDPNRGLFRQRVEEKTWVLHADYWVTRESGKPVSGIFIGTRTYQQGERDWLGEGAGYGWKQTGTLEVGLIVPGPRQNPVPVPLDQIRLESDHE